MQTGQPHFATGVWVTKEELCSNDFIFFKGRRGEECLSSSSSSSSKELFVHIHLSLPVDGFALLMDGTEGGEYSRKSFAIRRFVLLLRLFLEVLEVELPRNGGFGAVGVAVSGVFMIH